MSKLILVLISLSYVKACYWNHPAPYDFFGSKTPYDTVRGDIRDYETPDDCEAVAIWSLNRHGNRNPSLKVIAKMREVLAVKDDIVAQKHRSAFCTQDIENYKKWSWNETLKNRPNYLTGKGYEELYNIGKRIREKYGHLLQGTADQFYFRPTNEQRTIASCKAFVEGLIHNTNLNVTVEDPWDKDDVIRPYETCDRYKKLVKKGPEITEEIANYFNSSDFVAVQNAVQNRLGIPTNLTAENVFAMYEICRFYRSWTAELQDPWCAVFTEYDLAVLEYYDDIRHYYKNGYASQVNVDLGKAPLKDLYEKLEEVVNGEGKKVVAYFSHDTMMGMVWSALGLYKDEEPVQTLVRNPDRLWRYSLMGAFATNLMAVLNRCKGSGPDSYRVQLFINEKVTPICPVNGCKWKKFKEKFQPFTKSNLDFCVINNTYQETEDPVDISNEPEIGFLHW